VGENQLQSGLSLIRAGRLFEAHEELELAWRAAPARERDFYQGLVHVAVAWYQAGRGKPVATARQLEKAVRRLGPFAPEHLGVDVADVLAQVERARTIVARGSLELEPPRL
jgi:predicted metal-dependent hydrolase